jgi:hypothetical protein
MGDCVVSITATGAISIATIANLLGILGLYRRQNATQDLIASGMGEANRNIRELKENRP